MHAFTIVSQVSHSLVLSGDLLPSVIIKEVVEPEESMDLTLGGVAPIAASPAMGCSPFTALEGAAVSVKPGLRGCSPVPLPSSVPEIEVEVEVEVAKFLLCNHACL